MKRAFTLIELMVVMSIISMLSSVILVSLKSVREKSQVGAGIIFSRNADSALYSYVAGMWDFNDASNMGLDSSGNNNTLVFSSALTSPPGSTATADADTPTNSGTSARFDGGGEARTSASASLDSGGSITFSLWIKPDSFAHGANEVHWVYDPNQFGIVGSGNFWININSASCPYVYLTRCVIFSAPLELNKWIHVAVTYDQVKGYVSIYKNGKLFSDPVSIASPGTPMFSSSQGIHVNGVFGAISHDYSGQGRIDNVRVFKRALLASEVGEMFAIERSRHIAMTDDLK